MTKELAATGPKPSSDFALNLRDAKTLAIRASKTLLGIGLIALALWFAAKRWVLSYSSMAVITPTTKTVRAPISGFLSSAQAERSGTMPKDFLLGTITNPLVDDSELRLAEARLFSLSGERAALLKHRERLAETHDGYQENAHQYRGQRIVQLRHAVKESERLVASSELSFDHAKSRAERIAGLVASGASSQQDVETAKRDELVAGEQLAAEKERLLARERSLAALERGVDVGLLEGTPNQTLASSAVKELGLLLLDREGKIDQQAAELEALNQRLTIERERVAALEKHELRLPHPSRVVHVGATDGEYVKQGEELFRVSDCSKYVVIAFVSEATYNRLVPKGRALLKVKGTGEDFEGHIAELLGPFSTSGGALLKLDELAAPRADRFQVVVEFPTLVKRFGGDCRTGLTGEVYFDGAVWKPTW